MVQEGESPGLTAKRSLSQTGKPHRIVVGGGVELGDNSKSLIDAVVVDGLDVHLPDFRYVGVAAYGDGTEKVSNREQTAAVKPAGDVILGRKVAQRIVRKRSDDLLELIKVAGPRHFLSGSRVRHHKIAEAELASDVLAHLVGQSLACLADKTYTQLRRNASHTLLGRLQQVRHSRVVGLYQTAEVHSGVYLLGVPAVALVEHETHVGNDSEDIVLVLGIILQSLIVAAGHKDFGTGAFAHILLLLVQRILYSLAVLLEHQHIEQRQVGGIVSDRVFDQQNGPDSHIEDIVLGIEAVLEQLDNGNQQVSGIVPPENIVDMGLVAVLYVTVYLLRV